jgi:hypothetical protein
LKSGAAAPPRRRTGGAVVVEELEEELEEELKEHTRGGAVFAVLVGVWGLVWTAKCAGLWWWWWLLVPVVLKTVGGRGDGGNMEGTEEGPLAKEDIGKGMKVV